jgi:membrane protein DedA with SNARE-associated domain
MPKGVQRSNRERKKPKQSPKAVVPAARFIPAPVRTVVPLPDKKT